MHSSTDRAHELHAALLDYQRKPAPFSMSREMPAIFSSSIRGILQLAGGRGHADGNAPLQKAACFFVRSAMLHPRADHYALLGLASDSGMRTIKEHYRLLMRLLHPDFSASSSARWPADAAARVNIAYEVLVTTARRELYDEQRAAAAPRPVERPTRPVPLAAAPSKRVRDPRKILKLLAGTFGGVGLLALALVLLLTVSGETANLVQRPVSPLRELQEVKVDTESVPAGISQPTAPLAPPAPPVGAAPLPLSQAPGAIREPTSGVATELPVVNAPEAARTEVASVVVPPPPPIATFAAVNVDLRRDQVQRGPTMADVQPLIGAMLQHIQGGHGDRLLGMLDRDARSASGAQALSRQVELLGGPARAAKIANVQLSAEPSDAGLVVTGHLKMADSDTLRETPPQLSMRAEFALRAGKAVLVRLGPGGSAN